MAEAGEEHNQPARSRVVDEWGREVLYPWKADCSGHASVVSGLSRDGLAESPGIQAGRSHWRLDDVGTSTGRDAKEQADLAELPAEYYAQAKDDHSEAVIPIAALAAVVWVGALLWSIFS